MSDVFDTSPFKPMYSPGTTISLEPAASYAEPPVGALEHCIPSPSDAYRDMVTAYEEYQTALLSLCIEEGKLAQAREVLIRKQQQIVSQTDPKTLGANEEARKANLALQCSFELAQVAAFLPAVETRKCEVEVARIRCRLQDNTLRFVEMTLWKDALPED